MSFFFAMLLSLEIHSRLAFKSINKLNCEFILYDFHEILFKYVYKIRFDVTFVTSFT